MPKYGETTETNTTVTYLTPNDLKIDMGRVGNPTVEVQEAEVTEVDGNRVAYREGRKLFKEVTPGNGSTTFDVINENTGEVITSLTYANFRHVLYGLYVHLATEADT